jgi:hypothetical protein
MCVRVLSVRAVAALVGVTADALWVRSRQLGGRASLEDVVGALSEFGQVKPDVLVLLESTLNDCCQDMGLAELFDPH